MFFIELYSEEIPARMQKQAAQDFKSLFLKQFDDNGIAYAAAETFVSPQRLIFKAELSNKTASVQEEVRGPKTSAPAIALEGFLKANKCSKEALTEKNGYFYLEKQIESKDTQDLIPSILNSVIVSMPWPKVMRYPDSNISWVRPVRNIVCSLNGVPLQFYVEPFRLWTTAHTYGHRFISSSSISISTFEKYKDDLEKSFVIFDQNQRQKMIVEGLKKENCSLVYDQDLLDEVTGLCEYPFVHILDIDPDFMHLPACVLMTSMKNHQKYFSFKHGNDLAPYFGVVANCDPKSKDIMFKGFKTVLKARLSDACFFYDTDLSTPLMDNLEKLGSIIYQEKLGTLLDKVNRLQKCTDNKDLKVAIQLSKCDLITTMVGEFPELQGKMGHIYALKQEFSKEIAQAIEEQYETPTTFLGKELSLLDKMDGLVGFLSIGLKPTGSKDPYALRRLALGIIRILLTDDYKDTDLIKFIQLTINSFNHLESNPLEAVKEFILERFQNLMRNNYEHETISAVLKTTSTTITLWSLAKRIEFLDSFFKTGHGLIFKQCYKRAVGVEFTLHDVNSSLFESDYEHNLWNALSEATQKVSHLLKEHHYEDIVQLLSQIPINDFFDHVIVNAENFSVAQNRRALVSQFVCLANQIVILG